MNNFIYAKQPAPQDTKDRHGLFTGFKPSTVLLPKGFRISETTAPLTVDIIYEKDVAVTLRNGTTIYTDVLRPVTDEAVPTIVSWSPYGKSRGNAPQYDALFGLLGVDTSHLSGLQKFEGADPDWWCARGYALCHPDPRGCYYSDGDSRWWNREEGEDFHDLVEWCGTQGWSNGKVGAAGNSYLAASQWFMAAERPAHLAAIAPWEGLSDVYRDFAVRGGIPDLAFSEVLQDAFVGDNQREDLIGDVAAHPLLDALWERRGADFAKIDVPAYIVASYTNTIHTPGTFRGWRSISSEQKWLRIHSTMEWPDFYRTEAQEDLLKFFDRFLKGLENDWEATPTVRYTLHDLEGNDRTELAADQFPPAEAVATRFYLDAANGALTTDAPAAASTSYDAETSEGLASFSLTVDSDTAFIGYPSVRLYAAAEDADDMDIFVLLQKLDKNGELLEQITVPNNGPQMVGITRNGASILINKGSNGRLRASLRKLDMEQSTADVPVQSFNTEQKLTPGEVVAMDIALFPTGVLLYPGETLRLTISGQNVLGGAMPGHENVQPNNKGRHVIYTGGETASYLRIGTMPFAEN